MREFPRGSILSALPNPSPELPDDLSAEELLAYFRSLYKQADAVRRQVKRVIQMLEREEITRQELEDLIRGQLRKFPWPADDKLQ